MKKEELKTQLLKRRDFLYLIVIAALIISIIVNQRNFAESTRVAHHKMIKNELVLMKNDLESLVSIKDSVIDKRAKVIRQQAIEIQRALMRKDLTEQEKAELEKKLDNTKSALLQVKNEYIDYQNSIMMNMSDLLDQNDTEIQELRSKLEKTKNSLAYYKRKVREMEPEHLSESIEFSAKALNRRDVPTSKARYVEEIKCVLVVNESSLLEKIDFINVEIKDPSGKIISSDKDGFRLNGNENATFTFSPNEYSFESGTYLIKAYSTDADFEMKYKITLNNRI